MITHIIESYWNLDPMSKEDKVKVTNLLNSPKFQIFKQTLHATHLLKLLDKMCKYEMDPMSIVEDTERTRFCPQTDRQTDGRTDKGETSIPPFHFVEAEGIMTASNTSAGILCRLVHRTLLTWHSNRKFHS